MRPLVRFAFVALVVVPTLVCGDANAGAARGTRRAVRVQDDTHRRR